MGKSPGRWIKTVLFGKKHSKSNLPKNAKQGKKTVAETPAEDLSEHSPAISNPHEITHDVEENLELENSTSVLPCGTVASFPVSQDVESQSIFVSPPIGDTEMSRQGQAAAKVQAAFRGYLARRAFWALKGIIRLQALIRGHLVRRQAVATLRCMEAVVKLQALARGRRVRLSNSWPELHKKYTIPEFQDAKQVHIGEMSIYMSEKQVKNAYIRKLLLSLPMAMPLSLQYDLAEPNSAWNWLERWSSSRFWEPPPCPRKISNMKPQRKQHGGPQSAENDSGKSKRTFSKATSAVNVDNGALASYELDKPKRNPRKVMSHQTDVVQEQPQNELERVKRNLRKVAASVAGASEKAEMETEKPQQELITKTVLNSAAPDISEKEIVILTDNPAYAEVVDKQALVEAPLKTMNVNEPVDEQHDDHSLVESQSVEIGAKMESTPTHEEMGSKEDERGKENQKVRKRRSLPGKQENMENISQNAPNLPSYMAATESVKAKLRAQGSPKFSEDGPEHSYVRRHSLPASTNGKLNSMSPRIQKPMLGNGIKRRSKTPKAMSTSRDDKAHQVGWRR